MDKFVLTLDDDTAFSAAHSARPTETQPGLAAAAIPARARAARCIGRSRLRLRRAGAGGGRDLQLANAYLWSSRYELVPLSIRFAALAAALVRYPVVN
ncbi:hypothetical protein EVAR_38149_1 [Eumeta japonica]|uniref:Uncharacterized protein n=1 Tax=Eumeta variegata TaxID=151549 RepID=A0A4C1ZKG1_EUMVA|nr:hypothetical protein EVAR_38149_1 [Eumeta japonica]